SSTNPPDGSRGILKVQPTAQSAKPSLPRIPSMAVGGSLRSNLPGECNSHDSQTPPIVLMPKPDEPFQDSGATKGKSRWPTPTNLYNIHSPVSRVIQKRDQ